MQESAQFHLQVIHSAQEGVVVIDVNLRCVVWNAYMERVTGIAAADAIGERLLDRLPFLRDLEMERLLERALAGETITSPDTLYGLGRTGPEWIVHRLSPLHDGSGAIAGVVFIGTDITERKRAERALAESENRLRAILESEPECVKLIGVDGALLEMNPAGLAMIEAESIDQVRGHNVFPLIVPLHRDGFVRMVRDVFAGRNGELEFEIIGLKGTPRWLETRMVPLRNGEGRIIAALGVTRDTTENRQLEAQLRQTHKMESIGLLAGGVAHDFNNLLTIIAGNSETMATTLGPNSPVTPLVAEILRAAERAASLTRQLLAFSRRQVLDPVVLELNAVVTETEKMLRRLIGEDIVLTVALDEDLSLVKVDPGSLVQVLMNLAVNARDAMPKGGRLTIRTGDAHVEDTSGRNRTGPEPGHYATLAVADTGIGMTADVKARLFEPFFSTKRVDQGTGLGLAVVHGIVSQSGGSIHVESEPNRGTTFTIYFPAIGEPATAPRETVSNRQRGTETVLVAEDEPDVRNLAARALEGSGYTVLQAADGREALRVVDRHQAGVDLVVADVVMPEMDGRQLVEALRERYPEVKVLYTSGYTDDAVVRRGVLRSDVVLLQKPYTPQTLLHKCREVLAGARERPPH